MPARSLTKLAKEEMLKRETGVALLFLVEVDHGSFAEPVRFVNDKIAAVSDGDTFNPAAFDVLLPEEDPERIGKLVVRLDNVGQPLVEPLRQMLSDDPPTLRIWLVVSSEMDVRIPMGTTWRFVRVSWDAFAMEIELDLRDFVTAPVHRRRFTSAGFPTLRVG